ncbi:MAG TPA: hypothetical protein VFG68_15135 [Fimbriiglobus sp.]|nr:hypothetical protein [Fimbriiglobus sp.]
MSATGSLLAVLLAFAAPDRPSVADLSPVDRQTPDFYNALAVGPMGVQAEWAVDPPTVPINGELTLTLTVRHAANPPELVKPDLRTFDEFTKRFQVLDRTDQPAAPDAAEVRSTYGLRPRSTGEMKVPSLRYVYFRKDGNAWKSFTTYANSVPIIVTAPAPKPTPSTVPVPLDAPEEFFTLAEERPTATPGAFGWLLPVAVVPFAVIGWVVLWRWLFPDAVRLAKLRRNRAARLALDRLKKARTSADPAGAAASAFRGYLSARFGMPSAAQTPAEVSAALRAVECPADRAADSEAFLRACDAARFTPTPDGGVSLTLEAESLITEWEGAGE